MRQLPMSTGNADHAFQRSNFVRGTVFNSSEQRLNATIGKIDVEDEQFCFVEEPYRMGHDISI